MVVFFVIDFLATSSTKKKKKKKPSRISAIVLRVSEVAEMAANLYIPNLFAHLLPFV